jgi:hypothetical protein
MMNLGKTMKRLFLTGLVMAGVSFSPNELGAMVGHGKDVTILNDSDWARDLFIHVTTGDKLSEKTLYNGEIIYGNDTKITIHLDTENANLAIRVFSNDDRMDQYYAILGQAIEKKKFKFSEFKFSVPDVEHLISYSKFYCEIHDMSGISDLIIKDEGSDHIGWSTYVTWKK